jgi:hypothetical protein
LVVAVIATTILISPSIAAAEGSLNFGVVVNGQSAITSSDARPAQLYPTRPAELRITVTNMQSSTLRIASVRFEGEVLNMPLFSYDSIVDLVVPSASSRSLTFPVSMNGVGSQATGLIIATVTLLGPSGAAVASQSLVTNVHGSLKSLYGLFGLAVLVLTVSSLSLALLAMARHRLPQNRWLRGVRFLIPGFGVGLVLTFTLSAFGIFAPGPGHWLSLMIVTSAAGLALGYLTPAPNEEEFDDYDDDVLLAQILVVDDDPLEADDQSRSTTDFETPTVAASGVSDSRATAAP